jgi:hypothetical protein
MVKSMTQAVIDAARIYDRQLNLRLHTLHQYEILPFGNIKERTWIYRLPVFWSLAI